MKGLFSHDLLPVFSKNLKLKFWVTLLFFLIQISVFSQKSDEGSLENMIRSYQERAESASVLTDCGHALDGPSFWIKEMENKSLDTAVPITSKDRQKIGEEIYNEILRTNELFDNDKVRAEILEILESLSSSLNPDVRRSFILTILDSPEVNAFTTMGGYIYLTSGLLEFVNTRDELAFILGHEIGHDVNLHTQRKIAKVMVSSNFLSKVDLQDYTKLAVGVSTRFSAPFDQIDEYESDKFGALLAPEAGYDSNRFGDFFIKISNSRNSSLIDKLLSTHPFPEHRLECLEKYLSRK